MDNAVTRPSAKSTSWLYSSGGAYFSTRFNAAAKALKSRDDKDYVATKAESALTV
jgi:hypothetical protein